MRWTPRRAMLVLVACNLLWAGSYAGGKEAMKVLSPVELNGFRFAIAGLVLLPALWVGGLRIGRADLLRLGLLCLLGFVLNKAAEFSGLNLTTASDTALLIAAEGIFTAALGWAILGEPVRRGSVGGLAIGAIGVYIVIEGGLSLPHLGRGTQLLGDLLVVLALALEALYTILGKASLARYPGLLITAASIVGSLIVWAPATAIDMLRGGVPTMAAATWGSVLYMALGATVLGYVGWMVALRYVDAASAAATLFLQPLVGTALAVVVLGERPTWGTLAGGVCIMAGVWFASRAESRRIVAATVEAEALAG